MSPENTGPAPVITCAADLMAYLGFTHPHEQALILAFAEERGFSTVRGLVAWSLRYAHTYTRPTHPDHPNLSDGLLIAGRPDCAEPLGCGHYGLYSTYTRADGGSQCTACANAMRAASDYPGRDPIRP